MTQLKFNRAELAREVDVLRTIARPFIDPQTQWRLDRVLEQLRYAPNLGALRWEVPLDAPLVTVPSRGEYEQGGRRGERHLVGSLSFCWHLRLGRDVVELNGNATTKLVLADCRYEADDAQHHLGIWRIEVGAHDSPGACFHVQVVGNETEPPFPGTLPVPRLPALIPTPMAVLEFMLSELFQDRWKQAVGLGSSQALAWRNLQRQYWKAFLSWQQDQVREGIPSPWTALKQFPPADTFVTG